MSGKQASKKGDLSPLESEVIQDFREDIVSHHLRKIIIDVVKAISTLDVEQFGFEQAPITAALLERKEELKKAYNKRRKKK